jgi:hypothetical protein
MLAAITKAGLLNWEDYTMHRAHRYIASLFLTATLAAPLAMMAAPEPQVSLQVRVYDRDHKDYHNWDDREDHAYRGYLVEQHRTYRVYARQPRRTQREYWNWRHSHPDND